MGDKQFWSWKNERDTFLVVEWKFEVKFLPFKCTHLEFEWSILCSSDIIGAFRSVVTRSPSTYILMPVRLLHEIVYVEDLENEEERLKGVKKDQN